MRRFARHLLLTLLTLPVLAACARRAEVAFAPFQQAMFSAGQGFADLPLGTPLSAFGTRFGNPDLVGAIAGDFHAAELIYRTQALHFRFEMLPACVQGLQHAGRVVDGLGELRRPGEFLAHHPECADSPLQSVAVFSDADGAGWFQGATGQGVKLGSDKDLVLRNHGPSQQVRGVSLAGSSAEDSAFDELLYVNGLALYLGPASDGGSWRVRRIVAFAPLHE